MLCWSLGRRSGRFTGSGGYGSDETLGAGTDEILPVGFQQCFPDKVIVFWIAVLDQCPLHGLFVRISGNIDLFHGPGIQTGVVHYGGEGRGGGLEVLHLLRVVAHFPDIFRKLDGLLEG